MVTTAAQQPLRSRRCLLVDDDRDFARHMSGLLRIAGVAEILCVYRGHDALEELAGPSGYGLMITESRMTPPSGIPLIRRARAAGYYGPILLVSGLPDRDLVTAVDRLHGVTLLSKPFLPQRLIDITRELLADNRLPGPPSPADRSTTRADTADPA